MDRWRSVLIVVAFAVVAILLVAELALAGTAELHWQDLSNDETGFVVSRRDGCGGGSFVDIHTTAANTTTYVDPDAPEPTAEYRVRATSANGDSANTAPACWGRWKHATLGTPASHGALPVPPPH